MRLLGGILVSNYYLKRIKGNKNQGYQYQITSYEEYRQLKEKINNALDQSLEKLKGCLPQTERSKSVQSNNEPPKPKRIRAVKA
jgi:predicted transcriptional regulator